MNEITIGGFVPRNKDKPYKRKIDLQLTDRHLKKTVKLTHEAGLEIDLPEFKKELGIKLWTLIDSLYGGAIEELAADMGLEKI